MRAVFEASYRRLVGQLYGARCQGAAPSHGAVSPSAKIRAHDAASSGAHARSRCRVVPWFMGTDWLPRGARRLIRLGHVLVGGVGLVFAGVLIVAGRAPNAELDSVLVGLGLLLALAAVGFTCTAIVALRRAQNGHDGLLSLILSIIELAVGAAMAAALVVAVQGYGAFEPWRSPLLLPSALLLALGLAGLGVEAVANRPETH